MPKKGARTLIMDGEEYSWRIRKHATHAQRHEGFLNVSIESAGSAGAILIVRTQRSHPEGIYSPLAKIVPVMPSDVAGWVRQALKKGWQPSMDGPPFDLVVPVAVLPG